MTTKATEILPEIDWMRCNILGWDNHAVVYSASGTGANKKNYCALWIICCGEVEIKDIEEA